MHRAIPHHLPLLAALALSACTQPAGDSPAASAVARAECLRIAESYRTHRWLPSEENVLHGPDSRGIRVDTPDITYRPQGAIPGWWKAGEWTVGVPYQWGGFSSPAEFDAGVRAGKAAGDVYTAEKRRLLDYAVSGDAVGIDCSGFISRCWKLPRSFSTRELESLCDPLPSWDDLLPGDVLNTFNAHCLLFAGWDDAARTRLIAYETGSPPDWRVVAHTIDRAWLRSLGYAPLRYRGMRE